MKANDLLTGDVAKILDCSSEYVRQLETAGVLRARKTETGVRIFSLEDVQRVARGRAARVETRSARR